MGQGESSEIGRESSEIRGELNNSIDHGMNLEQIRQIRQIKHEGFLRISSTPFKNCQQIQFNSSRLFMENPRISLKKLIENKLRLNKRFEEEEIIKITQDLIFALAYLYTIQEPYPMLSIKHLFFSEGAFKLLHPQILCQDSYNYVRKSLKEKQKLFTPISPEMIIGIRCQEDRIDEKEILFKDNVFCLGMIMLEICTLKPSSECYDLDSYDIMGHVISRRISEIEAQYSKKVARIVANMLDYDESQRMNPKEMSIWVNRELQDQQEELSSHLECNPPLSIAPSRIVQEKTHNSRITPLEVPTINLHKQELEGKSQNSESCGSKSNCRISEIKQKIQREKLTIKVPEDKNRLFFTRKSRENLVEKSRSRSPFLQNRKAEKPYLPNPYLNADHLYVKTGNATRNDGRGYNREQRYQYARENIDLSGGLSSQRDRSLEVKYKYNVHHDKSIEHSGLKNQKNEENSQRKQSGRKINYDYCPPKSSQNITISAFDYKCHKYEKPSEKSRKIHSYLKEMSENELMRDPRPQARGEQREEKERKVEKGSMERMERMGSMESMENLERIRKEIEKSKRIIEEVKKSETQYNKIINF